MALLIDSLLLRRGERTIIAGLTARAEPGEALLLTGPNGAGKTTLLRAIAGLLQPAAGSICLEPRPAGSQAADDAPRLAELCHLVGHLNAVRPALSVAENASFWAAYLGGPASGVLPALERFRLAELAAIEAAYLSAGQKRRLGLTRLLLAPRPVWLLDEPAVSLDAASRDLLADIANHHLAAGGILVAATHQPLGFAPARELRLGVRPVAADGAEAGP